MRWKHRFLRFFSSPSVAMIRTFVLHMRPLIIIDGAHLKGEFLGTMYLAVAMDGNNQILPLAYGVGKSETFRSWDWFLTKLKECIIGKQDHLTIISDGAVSIASAIKNVFPNAFHGRCCRHLLMNLREKCPRFISKEELFWKACKAYRISDFEERFSTLRDWLPSIANKLDMIGLEKWARVHFPGMRYNYMTSNSAESVNALSRHSRKLPICMMIDWFIKSLQQWYFEHRQTADEHKHELTPWAEAKLAQRIAKSATWTVRPAANYLYNVVDYYKNATVDLNTRTCSCGQWQLSGLPCGHLIVVMRHLRQSSANQFAFSCFKTSVWRASYNEVIYDVGHPSECDSKRCTAVKVVLVIESVAEALVEKVNAKVAKLKVGPPEDDCDITPVVSESSANFIEGGLRGKRQEWLLEELRGKRPLFGPDLPQTEEIADVLDTFHVLAELPSDCFGVNIISMATSPSDVLAVELLQRECCVTKPLRVVPLFEKLADLEAAPAAMTRLFSIDWYKNRIAGTQEHYVAGSSEKDKEPTQEYILLPLHPHRPRISVEDVVQAAQEKPSKNSPKDSDVQDSEDVAETEEQHTLTEAEQVSKDDLERMIAQEIAAKAIDDATRQAFEEEKKRAAQATSINKLNTGRPSVSTSNSPLVSTANTPYASAASTPTGANTSGSSFVYLGGQIPIDASTLPNADLPIDPNMPDLEDDSNVFPNDGIFSGAYDDEDVGAEADFNNMDNTIDVSPIPTLRVHKDHPKG
ncbi:ankyrin repeat-containing protein [Tanacetum coccineum]